MAYVGSNSLIARWEKGQFAHPGGGWIDPLIAFPDGGVSVFHGLAYKGRGWCFFVGLHEGVHIASIPIGGLLIHQVANGGLGGWLGPGWDGEGRS